MSKPLTTHDVQITSATVEVKVLKVNHKQLTLAVFRQIPEENLFKLDNNLWAFFEENDFIPSDAYQGDPWVFVNYPAGNWHVVWIKNGELRRMSLGSTDDPREYYGYNLFRLREDLDLPHVYIAV